MRSILAVVVLSVAGTVPVLAFDQPKALVEAIYQPYLKNAAQPDIEQYYSARLKQLYAAKMDRDADEPQQEAVDPNAPDLLQFDPFIEGQHSLILDLVIAEPAVLGDHATVAVSFHNFDHKSLLTLALVKEPDGWKVDDIASLGGDENWLLSWLLQYDPFSAM